MMSRLRNLLARGAVLYILAAAIALVTIRHEKIVFKTLDYWKRTPETLIAYVQGTQQPNPFVYRQGIKYFKNILKLYPDVGSVYSAIGYCYYQLGDLKKARRNYERAAGMEMELFGMQYNLGVIYLRSGETDMARSAFETMLKISPQPSALHWQVVMQITNGSKEDLARQVLKFRLSYEHAAACINNGQCHPDAELIYYPPLYKVGLNGKDYFRM